MTLLHDRQAWRALASSAVTACEGTGHCVALADALRKAASAAFPGRGRQAQHDARDLRKTAERWCRGHPPTRAALAPELKRLAGLIEAHLVAAAADCRRERVDIDG